MTTLTPRLGLPFIAAAQAQKHVTHNDALERLDTVVQLAVQAFGATTPPASPFEGDVWALGATPTGVWAGLGWRIATFAAGGWTHQSPRPGWRAWGLGDGVLRVWTGSAWDAVGGMPGSVPLLGIGATADATNRLSVAAPATLFTHAGGGHQIKVNKAATTDTGSLLYQTGFSGRAELGLAGTDDLTLKVSADGATWRTALTAQGATGGVMLHQFARLVPGAVPAVPLRGMVYYDDATNRLRCWDGTVWRDLF
ncbi:Protein of unknown function [Loktanella fryxellensis]|uniref:DUF2793 domain-containing protein n=1 Tax=Loktanella fryxellensis TaxID=245187 RepID=A0A1H8GWM3_9RHOB|nr:DUF2793 domain-containing protein [Loktanella fryxellensis]SEN48179.1 Protein of unknown function [Loktanella fryxellensis]